MAWTQTPQLALWLIFIAVIGPAAGLLCYSCNYTSFLPASPDNSPDCSPEQFSPKRLAIASGPNNYYCAKGSFALTIPGGLRFTMFARFLTPDDSALPHFFTPKFCQSDYCNGEILPTTPSSGTDSPGTHSPFSPSSANVGLTGSPHLGLLSLLLPLLTVAAVKASV